MTTMDYRIGMIGIGLLGSALAERLLRAGWSVIGFDADAARRLEFAGQGGESATQAAAVAQSAQHVILSLPDSHVVERVTDEICDHLQPGAIVIDTTTGAPQSTEATAARLAARGVAFLDATVAGSSQQARLGEAVLMVGGERSAFETCHGLFEQLARQVFYLGPSGSGARMKLVVNLVLGLNRVVLAEGLNLARRCGMDLPTCLDVLRAGAAYSAIMDTKGPKMIGDDFSPQARLAQHHKDVELILELGRQSASALPLSQVHSELLRRAIELGYADADNSAVIKAFDGWLPSLRWHDD